MSLTISQLLAAAEDATIGKSTVASRLADAKQRLDELLADVSRMEGDLSNADQALEEAFDGLEQAGIDREASRKVVAGRVAELVALGVAVFQPMGDVADVKQDKSPAASAKPRKATSGKPAKADPIVAATLVKPEPEPEAPVDPDVAEPEITQVVTDPVEVPEVTPVLDIATESDDTLAATVEVMPEPQAETLPSEVPDDLPPFLQVADADERDVPALPGFLTGDDDGDTMVWEDNEDVVADVVDSEAFVADPNQETSLAPVAEVTEIEPDKAEGSEAVTTALRRPSFKPGARTNRPATVASQVTLEAPVNAVVESVLPAKNVFGTEDAPLDDDDSDLPPFMRKQP